MKSAFIKEIELINYRQFVRQIIKFKSEKGKNIFIIEGKNGFGKSNIFNAITWCLFGIEQHLKPDDRSLPICNTGQFKKIAPGKNLDTAVKIILETDEGTKEIERRVTTHKNQDGYHFQEKGELKVTELIGKNWKIAPYPEFIISRILPKDMGHFFFIDGEKLRQLFENINPDVIKKSIFDLSQITLLHKAIEHLDSFKASLRRNVKGKEPSVDMFEEKLEGLEKEIKDDKTYLEKLKSDRDDAYINKKKIDEQIQGVDDKSIKLLEEKRRNLEAEISYNENTLKDKQQEYFDYLVKLAPFIVTRKPIEETVGIISKMESAHKLPPKIQATFLEELLSHNKCICGRELKGKDGAPARKELERLLGDAKYSDIANDTVTLRYLLKASLKEPEKFNEKCKEFETALKTSEDNLSEKQKLLKEVDTKIGNIPVAKISQLHEERQKYINALQECNGKIGRVEETIRDNERRYREVEILWKRESGKKKEYKIIGEKVEICDKSIEQLNIIKEKIMSEIRAEIELKTKEYFTKLISAKSFESLKIRDDYELVVEKDGFNAVTSLSAAETLCLGYSFMSGLRQTSGFVVPIVIDTPLAKIDQEYRVNVADWFKKVLNDVQVILFVTDAEYTKEFQGEIKSCVAEHFLIKYDEGKGISEVITNG